MAQETHVFVEAQPQNGMLLAITNYLNDRASKDKAFALKYYASGKTVLGAVRYLAIKNMDNVILKDEKANGKRFDFAMNDNDADNEMAAQYFMDDSLNYEKKEEDKKAKTPAPKKDTTKSAPKSKVKTPVKNTAGMNVFAQVSKPTPAPQNVETLKSETPTEHVDPFAHLFEEPKNMSTGMDLFADL